MDWVMQAFDELTDMEEVVEDSATHEPPVPEDCIWDEYEFPKSLSPGAHRWRTATIAINAFNRIRMRLVLESVRPLDKEKAEQTAQRFNTLFAVPTLDEESQAKLPDPSSGSTIAAEEHHITETLFRKLIKDFRIASQFSSNDGKLSVVLESVWPVEPDNLLQVVDDVQALFEKVLDAELPSQSPMTVPGPHAVPMEVPGPNTEGIAWYEDLFKGAADLGYFPILDDSFKDPIASQGAGQVVGSSNSATGRIWIMNDAMQNGMNDPSTPESTITVPDALQTWANSRAISTAQVSEVAEMEGLQERRGSSDLDTQLQLLRKNPEHGQSWKNLKSDLQTRLETRIGEIDQASDRSKLKNMKSEAEAASDKLQCTLQKFTKDLEKFFDELRKNAGQQLHVKASIDRFRRGSFNTFQHATNCVVGKLGKLGKELGIRELTASKLFQNLGSALSLLVDNFLGGQSSNFISVADFSDWYLKSVYNLHLREGAGMVMSSY